MPTPHPSNPHESTSYLDWVKAHDPSRAEQADTLITRMGSEIRRSWAKPKAAISALERLTRGLPAEHLPRFWETVGHRMLRDAPQQAGSAYSKARAAERSNGHSSSPERLADSAALFARYGGLPAKELSAVQKLLAAELPGDRAHALFVRILEAWAHGGAAPPADLRTRVRASVKAAGLGAEEESRLLAHALAHARGTAVPDRLLDAAATVFAAVPPADDDVHARLAVLFPSSATDGGAWLRLLQAAGTFDRMAEGRLVPESGLTAWLSAFARQYNYVLAGGGGVMAQRKPEELFALLPRLAPGIRAEGSPVRLHESRYHHFCFDSDVVDACLAAGIPVEDPGPKVRLHLWHRGGRRDLAALAADPVLGGRLERAAHAPERVGFGQQRTGGTAISRLPDAPGVEPHVRSRIAGLIGRAADGPLGAAHQAVQELDGLLDAPTATALDGIGDDLSPLDLAAPLARTLRTGIPAELHWPALEEALGDPVLGDGPLKGATATWPVLTVFTRSGAVAVDHEGRRGACTFSLPEGAHQISVHFSGGDFLVGWAPPADGAHDSKASAPHRAFWASAPDAVFTPDRIHAMEPCRDWLEGAYGFQFEIEGGRHDGERLLRPGDRHGIGGEPRQMSDGSTVWSLRDGGPGAWGWAEVDPVTGERGPLSMPSFFEEVDLPDGWSWVDRALTLVRLPDGVPGSPLGSADGLSGFRVSQDTTARFRAPDRFVIEGVDGRRAEVPGGSAKDEPWAILRMPEGGADVVLFDQRGGVGPERTGPLAAYAAGGDGGDALLWQVWSLHDREVLSARGIHPELHDHLWFPPPAFWHFLMPADPASSRALRGADEEAARALIGAARTAPAGGEEAAVRDALARVLPGVTDPRVADGVVWAARWAAHILGIREDLSSRVDVVRSDARVSPPAPVPDAELFPALRGLLPLPSGAYSGSSAAHPALLTAIAADGALFRGEVDDEVRRLSPPVPPQDWSPLLGRIDAAALRFAVGVGADAERDALEALLRTWVEQPFAAPGRWRRGRASGKALAPLLAAGEAVATGTAPARDERRGYGRPAGAPLPEPGHPLDPEREYRFVQPDRAAPPEGAHGVEEVEIGRDDAERLRRLLSLVKDNGPVRVSADPEAVRVFIERTGVRRAVALLALDGLPRRAEFGTDYSPRFDEHKAMLRAAPYKANASVAAQADGAAASLGDEGRFRLLAAGVPDDPAELWRPGGTVAAAERMAAVWAEVLGTRAPVGEHAADQLQRDLGFSDRWAAELAAPRRFGSETHGLRCELMMDLFGFHPEVRTADEDGEFDRAGRSLRTTLFSTVPTLLSWALTERPVGDPAVVGVPRLYERLCARLDEPELLQRLDLVSFGGSGTDLAAVFGPDTHPVLPHPAPKEQRNDPVVYDGGLLLVEAGRTVQRPFLRPSVLADPEAVERTLKACEERGWREAALEIHRALVVRTGLGRMVERAASTPVPAGGYEADPSLSVPSLVAEVADELGSGPDAAALYLQLLALARPTDKNVRRWNGWTAARLKQAREELAALGAIVEEKRPRAGRTAFLPGPWTELKAPELPLETAKLDLYLARETRKEVTAPFGRLLPPIPLHELFTRAWRERRERTETMQS
ncbi:hypothetical protein O4J56_15800 [Nocardiopsis sp. RSe5-2]|uniref:DNA-binding protein n=1 Tax=Nocardiopsis endophytica TaxID=3018445 RepID=A0ABT4U588_9ACTN|nr:hypothetical protein [Nocardiopsis endophytica]MDA2812108.1 hypothetical protein [Nocardiopsis endophytica]